MSYPNTGMSSEASKGPTTVTVSGKMPMVKGAQYKQTAGDEAGTAGGGVVSGSTVLPQDLKSTSFGNHAFVGMNSKILDACAGPHMETEVRQEYIDNSIDSNPGLYGWERAGTASDVGSFAPVTSLK